ncbi:hypothetical protein [Lysinibacillus xylanilyticus]|uniref:hypothetical protein n=1 Tax=Lysinibacillus xylanilyticus TaxID=582475 RepID=UPI002B252537|nr:hypothetical protein [Lysinibacillus xylanilyticus]
MKNLAQIEQTRHTSNREETILTYLFSKWFYLSFCGVNSNGGVCRLNYHSTALFRS